MVSCGSEAFYQPLHAAREDPTRAVIRALPPASKDDYRIFDLIRFEVECPLPPHETKIPDEWLHQVVRGLRANIETSVRLCGEVGDTQLQHISPITEDDRFSDKSDYERTHGLSGCVISFASLFEKLVEVDLQRARVEFAAWPSDDDTAFARLRLWAAGKPKLATPHAFARTLRALSNNAFWSSHHQRDLLLALSSRWEELSKRDRRHIETMLLRGPDRWKGEDDGSYKQYRAGAVLERLQWLKSQGCEFSFDVDDKIATLLLDDPDWKPKCADRAADSLDMPAGSVATDTECGVLTRVPINSVLAKGKELSVWSETDRLKEYDPFAGLCAERPERAYLALAYAAKRAEYPKWAWEKFLFSPARQEDPSGFSAVVATKLCRFPDAEIATLLYPATYWLQHVSEALSREHPASFDRIVQRFIEVTRGNPQRASSALLSSSRGRDWAGEAINSPVGHIVCATLNDARIEPATPDSIESCLEKLGQCLTLAGNPRRHAIVLISHRLGWFHARNHQWVERHLLTVLDAEDDDDRDAFWAGFFRNPQISNPELYLRLKDGMLDMARQGRTPRDGHLPSLAYLILFGWSSSYGEEGRRLVSDSEFRDVLLHGGDEFRSHVLWQLERVLKEVEPAKQEQWQQSVLDFFKNIWPRQRSVKTSRMTAHLCEFLVSQNDSFVSIFDVVLPHLTKINDGSRLDIYVHRDMNTIANAYPKQLLHLLHTILPDDVRNWPHGVGGILEKLSEADESLLEDPRLIELRRKWNAR